MNMVDHLVGHATVVLKNVVLIRARGNRDLLCYREKLRKVLVWNVVQLGAVILGNH